MDLSAIKYLALEGGGGMGLTYLGMVRFFETYPEIPLLNNINNPDKNAHRLNILPLRPDSPLAGIAGSSAGAMTSMMLAIGMTANDISAESAAVNGVVPFDNFVEKPIPCLYKTVVFDGQRNVPSFGADRIRFTRTKVGGRTEIGERIVLANNGYREAHKLLKKRKDWKDIDSLKTLMRKVHRAQTRHTTMENLSVENIAKAAIMAIKKFVPGADQVLAVLDKAFPVNTYSELSKLLTPLSLLKKIYPLAAAIFIVKGKKGNSTIKKILKNPLIFMKYIRSFLLDRGLSTGIFARKYLAELIEKYLPIRGYRDNVQTFLQATGRTSIDGYTLTFKELYDITGRKLAITGTNITTQKAMVFSHEHTPDFPVLEAICISSSFPGVFKPTFINCDVVIPKDADERAEFMEHNKSYRGFYVDGGMLNNIPIHLFNDIMGGEIEESDNQQYSLEGVFGIGLAGGVPEHMRTAANRVGHDIGITKVAYDALLREDSPEKDFHAYLKERFDKKDEEKLEKKYLKATQQREAKVFDDDGNMTYVIGKQMLFPHYRHLFNFLGSMLSTWQYPMEDGQFFNKEIREQHYLKLFAYDLDTLNFNPDAHLSRFVQLQAFKALIARFSTRDLLTDRDYMRTLFPPIG